MLVTACLGFKGLKWLNYIAVPALVVVCLYGIIASMVQNDGGAVLAAYNPQVSSGLVFGMSMVVASFALGGLISADYCRFAKSRGDVVKSSIVGVIPAGLFMLLTGGVMSIVTGQYDISIILSNLGVPFFGLLALVLATWTTNVTNAYSGGLALSNLLGFDESKFKITTGIAGGVGTLLAAFGVLGKFEAFLNLMSALLPPLAGVIIANYWIVGKGRKDAFKIQDGVFCAGADRLSGRRVRRLPDGRHVCLLLLPCLAERSLLRRPGKRHHRIADPVRRSRKVMKSSRGRCTTSQNEVKALRKIGIQQIEDIALGASLLGAGGGGDPYIGKLMAIGAVRECGEVTLISPEEVPDDALIMPIAMMGAPTVLCEKGIGGTEYKRIFEMVERYFGRKVYATMPMEAGGVNSMLPIAAAARLGLPMVDCDGMGRAFPELQMVTFTIGGVSATPMALTDEKGNSVIFETITNQWTEELARSVTMSCGGSVTCSLYVMDGKTMKAYSVHDIVTRSEQLGKAIRNVKNATEGTPEENFLSVLRGHPAVQGQNIRRAAHHQRQVQLGQGAARGHRRLQGTSWRSDLPEREPLRQRGRQYTRHGAGSYLPGGYGDLYPRHDGRAEVRQARAGGGPEVLSHVAHAQGH